MSANNDDNCLKAHEDESKKNSDLSSSSPTQKPQSVLKNSLRYGMHKDESKKEEEDESKTVRLSFDNQLSIKGVIDNVADVENNYSDDISLLLEEEDEIHEEEGQASILKQSAISKQSTTSRSTISTNCINIDVRGSIENSKDIQRRWSEQTNEHRSTIKRSGCALVKGRQFWGIQKIIGYGFWCIISLIIQFSIGIQSWAFPDAGRSCLVTAGMDGDIPYISNNKICGLKDSLKEALPSLRFLSALILGSFLVGSVSLWLKRRESYCALCGATRSLLINVCSIVPEVRDKKLCARWIVLGYELSVLKARGLIDTDEGHKYLRRMNLVKGNEWDIMVDGDRHTTVWFWIQSKAKDLMQAKEISEFGFQTICNAVTLSRDRANDLMSPIDRDQPPPYVWTCGLLITINLWFMSMYYGVKWAILFADTDGKIWREARWYLEVFMMFFFTSIYAMLFDLCTILYNPFGNRKIDIKHYLVGSGIRRLANKLASGKAVPNTNDIVVDNSLKCTKDNEIECEKADEEISNLVERRRGSLMTIQKKLFSGSAKF